METRNLDVAESSSMSVMELNNMVVSMRSIIKKSYRPVIQKLNSLIKALQSKKGSEHQLLANKRKVDRLEEELKALKSVHADRFSKFALSNQLSWVQISNEAIPMERVMFRVADQPAVKKFVQKFRSEHDDWKSLASFLLTKNSGRRFMKKADKVQRQDRKRTGLDVKELEHKYEMQGYDRMSKEEASALKKERKERQKVQSKVETASHQLKSDQEDTIHTETVTEKCVSKKTDAGQCFDANKSVDTCSKAGPADLDVSISAEESPNDSLSSDNNSSLSSDDADSDSVSDNNNDQNSCSNVVSRDSNHIEKKREIQKKPAEKRASQESTNTWNVRKKPKIVPSSSNKSMVIKQIKLSEFTDKSGMLPIEQSDDVAFLFEQEEKKSHAKSKDAFFMGSDNADSEEENESAPVENENEETEDTGHDEHRKRKSKNKFKSTFIQNLGTAKNWKKNADAFRISNVDTANKPPRQKSEWTKEKKPGKQFQSGTSQHSNKWSKTQADENKNSKTEDKNSKTKSAAPSEQLHPSWEASKRRKQLTSGIQTFTGKKTTFDD